MNRNLNGEAAYIVALAYQQKFWDRINGNKIMDNINHPKHYTSHPSGVEAITVCEHMNFNLGNAFKYIWRADLKSDAIEDLKKAAWYLQREIERRSKDL